MSQWKVSKLALDATIENVKHELKPPVSNKLIFSDGIKTMLVGGPNQRDDYHVEMGEELFYQIIGDMELAILNPITYTRETIPIRQGQMFLLPAGVPHSPQRFAGTIGIVFERERNAKEVDCLRWYTDPLSTTILYQESFHCHDLGSQLKVVIERFQSLKPSLLQQGAIIDYSNKDEQSLLLGAFEAEAKEKLLQQNSLPTPIDLLQSLNSCNGIGFLYNSEFQVQYVKGDNEEWISSFPEGIREYIIWQYGSGSALVREDHENMDNESVSSIELKAGDMLTVALGEKSTESRIAVKGLSQDSIVLIISSVALL